MTKTLRTSRLASLLVCPAAFAFGCSGSNGDATAGQETSSAVTTSQSSLATPSSPVPFVSHCTYKGGFYYVSTAGSDSNSGSIGAPWATLNHAAAMVKPGDTVRIRGNGGVYYPGSQPTIGSVGTASSWICFEGQPGDPMPIYDGSRTNGSNPDGVLINGKYVVLQNIVVQNAKEHGIEVGVGGHFVDVVGNLVQGSSWAAITAGSASGDTSDVSDVRIHANEAYNNGVAGSVGPKAETTGTQWPAIVRSFGASNVSFTQNLVHQNWGEGIDLILTRGGDAKDNVAWDNYSVNLYVDNSEGIYVARNLIYWTGDSRFVRKDDGQAPSGIQMSEEQEYNASIKLSHNNLWNNVIVDCSSGINYGTYGLNLGMDNTVIAANTVYTSKGGETLSLGWSSGNSDNRIVDNVFVGGPAYFTQGQFADDHDLFFDVSNAGSIGGSDKVVADPKFVAAGELSAAAYKLESGSPASHAGVEVTGMISDFDGTMRANPPSLGAWE